MTKEQILFEESESEVEASLQCLCKWRRQNMEEALWRRKEERTMEDPPLKFAAQQMCHVYVRWK